MYKHKQLVKQGRVIAIKEWSISRKQFNKLTYYALKVLLLKLKDFTVIKIMYLGGAAGVPGVSGRLGGGEGAIPLSNGEGVRPLSNGASSSTSIETVDVVIQSREFILSSGLTFTIG